MRVYWMVVVGGLLLTSCSLRDLERSEKQSSASLSWTPAASSPGYISVANTTAVNAGGFDACIDSFVIGLTPVLSRSALKSYVTSHEGMGSTYGLSLESVLTIRASSGSIVHQDRVDRPLVAADYASASPEAHSPARVVFGWDGTVRGSDGVLAVAAQANYTVAVDVRLLRIEVATLVVSELDSGLLSTSVAANEAVSPCQAWVASYNILATSATKNVVVNGLDSGMPPTISWRGNRPVHVFGNFGTASAGDRLGAVRTGLWVHKNLFGVSSFSQLSSLAVDRDLLQADGSRVLQLSQVNTVGYHRRLDRGGMSALFDASDRLVAINGVLRPNLLATNLVELANLADAVAAIEQDLDGMGLSSDRTIALQRRVIFEKGNGLETGYQYSVGFDNANDSDTLSYKYIVSAVDGRVVLRRNAATPSEVTETITVSDFDPGLVTTLQGMVISESGPGIPSSGGIVSRSTTVLVDHQMGTLESRRLFLTGGPTTEPHMQLPSPVPASNSSNDCLATPSLGCKPRWYLTSSLNSYPSWIDPALPTAVTLSTQSLQSSRTAFSQIQRFWSTHGSYIGEGISSATLVVDSRRIRDSMSAEKGLYDPNLQYLYTQQSYDSVNSADPNRRDKSVYTPLHEFFHHIDSQTVDLESACRSDVTCPSDSPRQSNSLKEGLADFTALAVEPWAVNNVVAASTSLFSCLRPPVGVSYFDCVNLGAVTYRKQATTLQRVSEMVSPVADWPDCRVHSSPVSSVCLVIKRPSDTPASFRWTGPIDGNTAYRFVPVTLMDAWETTTSMIAAVEDAAAAESFAERFPMIVFKAFALLPCDANLTEFRYILQSVVAEDLSHESAFQARVAVAAIGLAFDRHGVDADLRQYCNSNSCR